MTSKSSASGELKETIGHYMNAVAEALLRDGVPVKYARASTDTRAAADDATIATDVDGDIGFNISFELCSRSISAPTTVRLIPDARLFTRAPGQRRRGVGL
ncbi:hypothetical protein ACH5AO_29675 [Streptomyces sp. NPDC018964]|uniref:hypothetical protein n=1 Tax=unclassified Streptomyces TaxID=2593676 RepID=UPI00379D4420